MGTTVTAPDPRRVFVIHGRDEKLRNGMFNFLRALDLSPLEWTEAVRLTGKASPYIGEVLDSAFSHAQAIVVLFSPDDEARLRPALWGSSEPPHEKELTPQARPNVLFEAGMATARNPDRTVLVEIGSLRPFSDVGGRHAIRMDDTPQKRQDLALRLQKAGCPVKLTGTDWQTTGDLAQPSAIADPTPIMNSLVPVPSQQYRDQRLAPKNEFARVNLRSRRKGQIPTTPVTIFEVFGEIENLSSSKRIREYSCTLSVPKRCLSWTGATYLAEVESPEADYRKLRLTERHHNGVPIHPGDLFQIVSVEIAVGHLAQEDRDKCLKMEVLANAVVDGEALQTRKTVAELVSV